MITTDEQLGQLLAKLNEAAPALTQLAVDAAWFEALASLFVGLFALAALTIIWRIALIGHVATWLAAWNDHDHPGALFAWGGIAVGTFVTGIVAVLNLFDPWVYITLVRPELWVTKRLLGI